LNKVDDDKPAAAGGADAAGIPAGASPE